MWRRVLNKVPELQYAFFHRCMFGSSRDKYTRLAHFCTGFEALAVKCSKDHDHASWGKAPSGFATSEETAYPKGLCLAYARALQTILVNLGAHVGPEELSVAIPVSLHFQSRVASGTQPRGKRIPSMVREYKLICKLTGPPALLPPGQKLAKAFVVPSGLSRMPPVPLLPQESRVLYTLTIPEKLRSV